MIKLMRFFFHHSIRDMLRNRSRTMFALVCVATGVSAVVALRTLAFMVADELTTDLAEMNRGDIRVYASRDVPEIVELSALDSPVFSRAGYQLITEWAEKEEVDITAARLGSVTSLRRIVNGRSEPPQPVLDLYIEPEHYPFYDTVILDDPAGLTLADAFGEGENDVVATARIMSAQIGALAAQAVLPSYVTPAAAWAVYPAQVVSNLRPLVISRNLMHRSSLNLQIGDVVRLGAADTLFVVVGSVPSDSESILSNPQTAFMDYVYVSIADLPYKGQQALPDQIFIKAEIGRDIAALERSLVDFLDAQFDTDTDFDKELNRVTTAELQDQNAETAGIIDDMILVMGLSSLLIGGIGIINTMLVVVSRRTVEIAVLKTLGLKGNRVTGLFLVEAALMGLLGSIIGVIFGVILSYLIKNVGEEAFRLSLEWRLYPEAMLSGLFLGMIMTILFGFLPTLIAGQVRPAVVLRPNEAQMPAAGLLQTLVTLIVMIVVLGLLVNTVVENALIVGPLYMFGGAGALIGLFVGVIIANTGIADPLPDYFVFRLSRRFERLENWITGAAGWLTGWLRTGSRRERGQRAVTMLLRMLRQTVLLYGSLAIGVVLASGTFLILSEIWLPASLGEVKPANDVINAAKHNDILWVTSWSMVTLLIGFAIRWFSRALVGVIALASLGTTLGSVVGVALGNAAAALLDGTPVWDFLADISTGVVIVEGMLALLGAIFIGYWLLVWAVGKMPGWLLMGLVSLTLVLILAGAGYSVTQFGVIAVAALAGFAGLFWLIVRSERWKELGQAGIFRRFGLSQSQQATEIAHYTAQSASLVLLSVAGLAIGFGVLDEFGQRFQWLALLIGLVVVVALWRHLRRHYGVDARLILREMSGRRNRTASTLLGLSVGIAGLSLVSLTTSAVSHILDTQISERIEGNLLIVTNLEDQREVIRDTLDGADGVDGFAQYTTYRAVLMSINGKPIENRRYDNQDEQDDPRENSNFEAPEQGFYTFLSEREDLSKLPEYRMVDGRQLAPNDIGKHNIMLRESFFTEQYNITAGTRLMFLFENGLGDQDDVLLRFTVTGIIALSSEQTTFGDQFVIPPDTLPEIILPDSIVTIAMIDESDPVYMDNVMIKLSDLPGVFAIELSDLTELIERLIEQLRAIPTLVAWLALVAGTAIIANTVALATQERRRQIGVMKAVGLKGRRVLGMLMIENGLIGLIAGLIGVAVGLLVTVVLVLASLGQDQVRDALEFSTVGLLILMSIGVAISAATLSAWGSAAEKPMNVLRYE
ncbi:MAG: FtsX-like permease family protein [Anaerolineae bacterium]|nr:FtsX-like permease family protein [Anaerolineae bacterium]